ncbi:MAG: hypothetical protein ABR588_10430 [Sphingomicrobium sp.]
MTSARLLPPILFSLLLLGACSTRGIHPPSLAPRAAEAIDPRLPVERPLVQRPVDAGVRSRLAALIDEARAGEAAFRMAYGPAERAAGAAGAPQSESWIAAQELLSALEAARAPTSRAVGEIDALAGERVHGTGGIGA